MSEYYVRKGKYAPEVAKFSDSREPLDVYTLTSRGCTCPARTRNCKHTRIVDRWELWVVHKDVVFNDSAEVVWEWKL